MAVNDKNLQETETLVRWNKKSKQSIERFYNCIVIVELDKAAVQYKNLQETETSVTIKEQEKQAIKRKILHQH